MTGHETDAVQGGGLEEKMVGFDETINSIRALPDSLQYTSLVSLLNQKASEFYHLNKDHASGKLVLDEGKAKNLSKTLWNVAAEHVAKHYLGLKDEKIAVLKGTKDPDTGKDQWTNLITTILGIDEDTFYTNLKTRSVIEPSQIETIPRPLYETHLNTATSKRVATKIKDNTDADAALNYASGLKGEFPKALQSVGVPKTYANVQDVQRLIATMAGAVPIDYPVHLAQKYAGKHKN